MKSNKKDYLQIKNDLPNISLLEETAKTYYYLFTHKQPKDDFNHIFSSLEKIFLRSTEEAPAVIFSDSQYVKQMFIEDHLENLTDALKISWALGYDFGENNPRQARNILPVVNFDNEFLPETLRKNMIVLGDFAAMMSVNIMQYLHNLDFISAPDLINGSSAARRIHRDGVFTTFKNGTNYFYTS